jgi:hypothetical protein
MLGFNSDLPFYYSAFCILFGVAYASFLYIREKIITYRLSLGLFLFRAIFTSILASLLLNPVIKSNVNTTEKPIVIIAKDDSESIQENINKELEFLIEKLKGFEIFSYSFSDKINDGFSQDNNGLRTNYSQLFTELSNKFENRNVAGLVMASDGCYNTGSNPEYLSYDFPVYSIALGDTATYNDVRIDDILKNDIAFLGNTFPLEVSLASSVSKNEVSKLKIWNNGVKVHEESVTFLKDINYNTYTIFLPANKIGLQTYTIQVDALNDERNIINNTFKIYIDVIDSRCNILILKDGISPDLSAYKSTIDKNKNYKIEVKDISDNIVIEKYQLAVIFGVNNIPASIVNNDIPLIIFNSSLSTYHNFKSVVRFTAKGGMEEVSPYKSQDFSKFSFSSELLRLIADAPPLFSLFGRYNYEGNIEFVLNQKIGAFESDNPVIMIQELDSRKVAFVSAEGWWRWKLYDYSLNNNNLAFDELFSKLSQYLVLQEDKSLFRLKYEKQYEENNEVVFHASLYNESYELVNNKEVDLKLIDEKDREYNFQFSKENNKLLAKLGILEVGTYNFTANVRGVDLLKRGVFDVKKIQLEQLGLSANHEVLSKIASLSDGKVFSLNSIQDLIENIKDSERNKKIIHSKEKLEGLINIPWILLGLLFLISVEWFIRKYKGLI